MTQPFALSDTRHYPTVDVVTGFGEWASTYDQTVHHQLDLALLAHLHTVPWLQLHRAVDLAVARAASANGCDSRASRICTGWTAPLPWHVKMRPNRSMRRCASQT